MGKVGRPEGYRAYELINILSGVDELPRNTLDITRRLKKFYPKINRLTVLKYLEQLEKEGYVREIYKSKNKNKIKIWIKK